jgi:dipeptidyl aminopeptidase/acylaminoacyl peptidase
LIVYPNQFHGLTMPNFQKDRFDRYIEWFNKYLKN